MDALGLSKLAQVTDTRTSQGLCPDCNRPLHQIDERPGKEAWVCMVAVEAQRRGLLGKPGRKHSAATIWVSRASRQRDDIEALWRDSDLVCTLPVTLLGTLPGTTQKQPVK